MNSLFSICLLDFLLIYQLLGLPEVMMEGKKKKRERKLDQCKRNLPQGCASQRSLTNSTLPVHAEILTNQPITSSISYVLKYISQALFNR